MAKKKASAKKSNVKKVAKKATVKKTPKKSVKKAPAKVKKAAKPAAKKSSSKKVVTKSKASKPAASAKAVKPAKKAATKAPAAKAPAVKAAPAVVKPKAEKVIDLSDFVTPLDDRLIVQTSGAEKMTAGGLYIPDTVADVSGNLQGHVVAVGRGHQSKKGHVRPMDVKLGDKIVFSEHAGNKINIQNQDLIILREVDVLGVVSK